MRLSVFPRSRQRTERARLSCRASRGLTLIELAITVTVIALVAGLSVVSIQSLSHSKLRSTSVAIAGAIKESYDRSIMEKRIQRIAFDLDEHVWWVEYTEDPYALNVETLTREDEDERDDDLFLDEDTPPEVRAALEGNRAASFNPDPSFGKRMELPGSIHFGRAWTGMREEPFEKGIVFVHFFRGGFTEPLQLELYDGSPDADPDEREWITLKVRPLTGRVRLYSKRLAEPEDEGRPWEEQDR